MPQTGQTFICRSTSLRKSVSPQSSQRSHRPLGTPRLGRVAVQPFAAPGGRGATRAGPWRLVDSPIDMRRLAYNSGNEPWAAPGARWRWRTRPDHAHLSSRPATSTMPTNSLPKPAGAGAAYRSMRPATDPPESSIACPADYVAAGRDLLVRLLPAGAQRWRPEDQLALDRAVRRRRVRRCPPGRSTPWIDQPTGRGRPRAGRLRPRAGRRAERRRSPPGCRVHAADSIATCGAGGGLNPAAGVAGLRPHSSGRRPCSRTWSRRSPTATSAGRARSA